MRALIKACNNFQAQTAVAPINTHMHDGTSLVGKANYNSWVAPNLKAATPITATIHHPWQFTPEQEQHLEQLQQRQSTAGGLL